MTPFGTPLFRQSTNIFLLGGCWWEVPGIFRSVIYLEYEWFGIPNLSTVSRLWLYRDICHPLAGFGSEDKNHLQIDSITNNKPESC